MPIYDQGEGAFRRLSDQIAKRARTTGSGPFDYHFSGSYEFEIVAYPHGESVVRGVFRGQVSDRGSHLSISGIIRYDFEDVFTDPTDLRELIAKGRERRRELRAALVKLARRLGISESDVPPVEDIDPDDVPGWFYRLTEIRGTAYPLTASWSSTFEAEILKDRDRSIYRWL